MNTRYIPAIVMLLGGLVRSIVGIIDKEELTLSYTISLLVVLFIFYIIGGIIKAILDKYVPLKTDDDLEDEEGSDEIKELENIQENETIHSENEPE